MRTLLATLCLLAAAAPAGAISRYHASGMSCPQIHSLINEEGAVVLHYRAADNPSVPRFGRYVAGGSQCPYMRKAAETSVPSGDGTRCEVKTCVSER
jgi:hypothetical protein